MAHKAWQTVPAKRIKEVAKEPNIDKAVEKVARELTEGLVGPPTDLIALAKRLNIFAIQHDDTMVVPGELRDMKGRLVIFLIPNLPSSRRRFTIAHELGHAVFERLGMRPRPSWELERICDKFAAEFLMPRETFRFYAGPEPSLRRIRELCSTFNTSLQATICRAGNIYNYRAFESREDTVVWNLDLNKRVFPLLRSAVAGLDGLSGSERIDLYEYGYSTAWTLEWESLSSMNHRIGLLRPRSRYQH